MSQFYFDVNRRNSLKEEEKSSIVNGLLSRLETKEDSLEVKGCTVKNLSLISKFLKENEIIQIFSKIILYLTDQKAVGKDIYVICIKGILKEVSANSCYTVGKIIVPELIKGIQSNNLEIRELCFDTFNDYINTFNYVLIKESESVIQKKDAIVSIAIDTLSLDNPSIRNKVANFLGSFSVILNKQQIASLLAGLVTKLEKSKDLNEKITLFSTLNSIAKATANRHTDLLKNIISHIYEICNRNYLEINKDDNYDLNNDLVESALNLYETYIIKLTNQIKGEIETIIKLALELMEYDPNYAYSDVTEDYNAYDYEGYEGYDAFIIGDDSSWKVRRAAVRVIHSMVKSRMEIKPRYLIEVVVEKLVFCLREHEENTKLDIISTLSSFLRNLVIDQNKDISSTADHSLSVVRTNSMSSIVPKVIHNLVDVMIKEFKGNNQNVKGALLQMLASLALVDAADLIVELGNLKNYLEPCLNDNINALTFFEFLSRLLKSLTNCVDVTPHFDDLVKWVIQGLKNDFYKINIQSLNVTFHLIRLFYENLSPNEYKFYVDTIYRELYPKFKANDVDQELKLTLISSVGNLVMFLGHTLPFKSIEEIFSIFFDKTKNENLRPLIFNWINNILKNNKEINFADSLTQFIPLILELLIKQNLHIQYQTLEFLANILSYSASAVCGNENKIIEALLNITTEDSLVPLIYEILNAIVKYFKISSDTNENTLLKTIKVLENSKEHATNLNSIFSYIESSSKLLDEKTLKSHIHTNLDFSNLNSNKAKCFAILAKSSDSQEEVINLCIKKLTTKIDENSKKNVLLLLGESCLQSNKFNSDLLNILEKMLNTSNEDLKTSVSLSIGKVAVSYPKTFIENYVTTSSKDNLFYYFIAIREFLHVITTDTNIKIDPSNISSLFNILSKSAKDSDEKLRLLSGECLGLISLVNDMALNEYVKFLQSTDSLIRSTFYYGLKYIFNNTSPKVAEFLLNYLINGLYDKDIFVKQNAFNSLIAFTHNYADKLKNNFNDVWIAFKEEHIVKPELVESVNIGLGMNIKNDKGLPIRKAIHSMIKLLFDIMPEKIHISETLQICVYGLGKYFFNLLDDHDDIQSLTHGTLLKISHYAPEAFISIIDILLDHFKKKIDILKKAGIQGMKVMDTKKLSDLYGNIRRLFDELKKVHEIEENPKFIDLNNEIQTASI